MPVDAVRALQAEPRRSRVAWDRGDVMLYHLGIGAGVPATDPAELRYTLENRLHVLPSFATVAGGAMDWADAVSAPGIGSDLSGVLHGTQSLILHRPVPVRGDATRTTAVTAVHDKGTAAVVALRSEVADAGGPLWTGEARIFLRGQGGFGGERGASPRPPAPGGRPALVLERTLREDQALLYRLCGDRNPLHADPDVARRAGYDRPILHGLCSYGVVLKALVDTELNGDVTRVRGYDARFTGVVFPGETLRLSVWRTARDARVVTASVVERDDAPVLTATVHCDR
ncbi:MaoC/PaaZ C-terminal domain-containing protein [Streptomyces sp. TR06-5]|uniref:MaoC/PaaZ C-terminal domain-containing protein n=1 Tax=Streptomyces sp. TR06-5 TaxID=3385976 RepID=UPI0039A14667